MKEIFSTLVGQLNSSLCVLLILLAVVVWGVYMLGVLRERFAHHEQRLQKADESRDLLTRVATKVDFIYEFTNPRGLARSQSPMALTDLGREVSAEINAPALYEKYQAVLMADLSAACSSDANAYDIQVEAFRVARENLPKLLRADEVNRLKQVAFNKGIILDDMWIIFGILLRDKALAERGLSALEVDQHTPPV